MRLRILVPAMALAATAAVAGATVHAAAAPKAAAPVVAPEAAAPVAAHAAAVGTHTAAAKSPGVRVVRPGRVVSAGHGQYLKLTRTERCVGTPPDDWFTCKSVVDGNQPAGTVGVQTSGDASGTFYSPLYIGDGRGARMTLTAQGVTYQVQVVTLAGHPGYATGYVWGAPVSGTPGQIPQITVYDAAGTVLAQS